MQNIQVVLARRPSGEVEPSCFELREAPVPAAGVDGVVVRNIYLSCDPYMRGQFSESPTYKSPFALGDAVPARVVGQVVQSRHEDFREGDVVWGFLAWEHFTAVDGTGLRKVNPALGPISHAISVLGMPGLTAYMGLVEIGRPKAGETAFVSAASGAVGQVAGQLARIHGCRAVGSTGTDAKVRHITGPLRFDSGFNYKRPPGIEASLDRCCPDGIDIYFDNVGGATLDAVLARLNPGARIAVCGQISQYDNTGAGFPLRNVSAILGTRSTMTGFSVREHMHRFDAVVERLAGWMASGELVYVEDIVDGIENTPAAFVGMMRGENVGKRLVRVGADPTL